MSEVGTILLRVETGGLADLEGRLFQVHIVNPDALRLVPCWLAAPDTRCPVVIKGERCGGKAGHPGKHTWSNGD